VIADVHTWIKRVSGGVLPIVLISTSPAALVAQPSQPSSTPSIETTPQRPNNQIKELMTVSATPETRPPIMPSEARETMRLMLAGKIDQWFAKIDGSGAVFVMNVTDPGEVHALLEKLPLGQADMMRFELIPVGPLWPLGLLLHEPAK
jgi:hypothetical protein